VCHWTARGVGRKLDQARVCWPVRNPIARPGESSTQTPLASP
jgi:hypothetical protein